MNKIYAEKIAFIGLGKLGMPCAEVIAKKGFDVSGFDIVTKSSNHVNIKQNLKETVQDRDIVFVATPTPHEEGYDGRVPTSHLPVKDFKYDAVKHVLTQCNKHMNKEQTLVLISTVLPGTIRRELAPLVTNTKLMYNPYLIAMGTVAWDMVNPEMVMIGSKNGMQGTNCKIRSLLLESFYNQICESPPRVEIGTWEEVECMKVFYNTFLSMKLAYTNMVQDVCQRIGHANVDVVTQAFAKSKMRLGADVYIKSGMGDGGACHPRDNIALSWLAKNLDLGYDFFKGIMTAREKQAENMAQEVLKHGTNIYFTSDSYKPGVDMPDGSYSLLVQYYVKKHGGQIVNGFDNQVHVIFKVHESDKFTTDQSVKIFDPWRSHPKGANVIYYGYPTKNSA